ncbi:luciferase family protein [Streptomyces sp. MK5]|uniref:luciferase domain-containing protein n=1 Tax=Streptomyces sp. MK5 TaxID=3064253 RepID=UPI0027411F5B|nr:luciferase family protein [Streptomyces sp. MK5]
MKAEDALCAGVRLVHADSMNLAEPADQRLMDWSALSRGRGSCGERRCLCAADGTEIVHFHGDCEAEVHLTRPLIAKLQPVLRRSSAVALSPASDWVAVRLEVSSDIDLLATLVSAALLGADRLSTATSACTPPDLCGHGARCA